MLNRKLFYIIPIFLLLTLGLLFFNYKERKDKIQIAICKNNLAAIGNSFFYYYYTNKIWPPEERWCDVLIKGSDLDEECLTCPCSFHSKCSYAFNKYVWGKDLEKVDANVVLMFESVDGWNSVGTREILEIMNHKPLGCNIMFTDGHVEYIKSDQIIELSWGNE